MAKTKSTAKAAADKAKEKQPDLTKLYGRKASPINIYTQDFRTQIVRRDAPVARDRILPGEGLIESLEWRYEEGNPTLLGTAIVREPDIGTKVKVKDGHVIRLQVRTGGKYRELWRMRLHDGKTNLDGVTTFEMADDGKILQESTDSWHFTKSKKKGKPKGWKTHEIVREVARRYRVPLGKIAEGTHYITDLSGEFSPMEVIQKAYALEKNANGRRFTILWKNGKLNVVPMRRNPLMHVLSSLIESADVGREDRDENFATAVTVRASVKQKGSRKRQKIVVRHVNEKAVKADGFIHRPLSGEDVKDKADAIRKAKRYILKHSDRKPTLTGLQHRGIAFLRRGDAIRVGISGTEFNGRKGICFIKSGVWQLAGGSFTMSLDLVFDDPYFTPREQRKKNDKARRAEKRAAKKKA